MQNSQISIGAIVLGVVVAIIGILLLANVFGAHHTLPYIVLAVGVILIIVGIFGMVSVRRQGRM